MNLQTIIETIEFIRNEIETRKIIEKYENLLAVITSIRNKPDKNVSANLTKAKKELIRVLNETEPGKFGHIREVKLCMKSIRKIL